VPVTEQVRDTTTSASTGIPAVQADRDLRDGAQPVEITHHVTRRSWPRFRPAQSCQVEGVEHTL
jgi:hypothetical protein